MYRIAAAAIKWYVTRGTSEKGDLERVIVEAIEEARAAHIYIRAIDGSLPPQGH